MIFIDEKGLTEVKEANEVIAKAINERLLEMVDQFVKLNDVAIPKEQINQLYRSVFPDNYPENKRIDKLVDLRTLISDRKKKEMDSVSKYMLFMILESFTYISKELLDSTILPLDSRKLIAIKLTKSGKYNAREVVQIINRYEDINNYIEVIFDAFEFLDIEEMSEQELSRLELKELVEAKRKEKMAPMM